ncbi:predicted protein [Thalassiosira pseudonana CCMP1335]|uniref:Prenyltransferase alpha-alpha toroid domain-containing protein n=1 Tax=Thalassiosira pseudonana TaxID=35128 RepID=B8LDD8_THAPS|nr:predicted protein [Thalassiosira pseudonana CCMP1335]EED86692.1 predicted protein [Thalassiosira pseudonana CCMP1335]
MKKFERLRHIRYFTHSLQNLPSQYSSADTNRLTLVHFCIQSLDVLGALPDHHGRFCGDVETEVYLDREEIVEWIYALQTLPLYDEQSTPPTANHPYDHSHLAMTYVALCTLVALGDDLSRIDRSAILQTLSGSQKEDGSFVAISSKYNGGEAKKDEKEDDDCDLRFMYTAISICSSICNTSTINIQSATSYILSCISYEGALGLTPGREGHGGSTFCGIASLYLMGVLDEVLDSKETMGWKEDLIRWCVMRQYSLSSRSNENNPNVMNNGYDGDVNNAAGMQGRPNKLQDTCYSYWIGGTLHLLDASHLLDGWALREYVLQCQSPYGGFGKTVNAMPDLLHSFYSMAWLAISEEGRCCVEEVDEDGVAEESEDDNDGTEYASDVQQQVHKSIRDLSRLDCALGMCAKRRSALKKAVKSMEV